MLGAYILGILSSWGAIVTVHCPSFTKMAFLVPKISVSEGNILWYKVQIYFKTLMVGDVPKSSSGYREHKWYQLMYAVSSYSIPMTEFHS